MSAPAATLSANAPQRMRGAGAPLPHARRASDRARRSLRAAGATWLALAVVGQLLFAFYIVALYGRATLAGRWNDWNRVMPHGYVPGDTALNIVLGMHLLFAAMIIVGGALQVLPALRRRVPAFHRWNGRAYLLSAAILGIGGLVLVWVRGAVGDLSQHVSISINALLILAFAAIAWRHARARRIDAHRRWALRLFLAVSGVWFFRIGLMAWIVANRGPVGFDPSTFSGPTLTVLAFGQYLLPLAVLELWLRVSDRGGTLAAWTTTALLALCSVLTLGGIAAATALMWWPRI